MGRGVGTAIIDFGSGAQAAVTRATSTISDSVPNPCRFTQCQSVPGVEQSGIGNIAYCYGAGAYVALATAVISSDGASAVPGNQALRSVNGIKWAAVTLPATLDWAYVAASATLFVAVAYGDGAGGFTNKYATSTDGINWTLRTFPVAAYWTDWGVGIAYGAGLFTLILGGDGAGGGVTTYYTSPDGITWTARNFPVAASWATVLYAGGRFLALPQTAGLNTIYTSIDGISWAPAALPNPGADCNWYNVVHNGSVYLAIGFTVTNVTVAALSTDGATWVRGAAAEAAIGVDYILSPAHSCSQFIGIKNDGKYVASADGVDWVQNNSPSLEYVAASCATKFGNQTLLLVSRWKNTMPMDIDMTPLITTDATQLSANVRTITEVVSLETPAKPVVGSNTARTAVTGQSGILATDNVGVWIQSNDSTEDHNATEHAMVPINLSATNIVPDVGFDIVASSPFRLTGKFKVRYVWAS